MIQMGTENICEQIHHRKNQWVKDQIDSIDVLRQEYIAE